MLPYLGVLFYSVSISLGPFKAELNYFDKIFKQFRLVYVQFVFFTRKLNWLKLNSF